MADRRSPQTVVPPFPAVPDRSDLERLLDKHAPFRPVPLCPSIGAYSAGSLVEVWEAAERLAGGEVPSPFWAFPWPAGIALARTILDEPGLVQGRTVIDIGAGGGVSCFAAALTGAARVVACDIDPWALAVTRLAADRQAADVEIVSADITVSPSVLDGFDVVLCGDLAFERSSAARQRAALARAAGGGGLVLIADAGRTWFDASDLEFMAEHVLEVVPDLEGCARRVARVYRMRSSA